jgi:hypothetical protein
MGSRGRDVNVMAHTYASAEQRRGGGDPPTTVTRLITTDLQLS